MRLPTSPEATLLDAAELEEIALELERPQSLSGAHALWNRIAALGASEVAQLVARLGLLRSGDLAGSNDKAVREVA